MNTGDYGNSRGNYGESRGNYGESRYPGMPFPVYRDDRMRGGGDDMNRIGFDANRDRGASYPVRSNYEMTHDYPMDAGYEMRSEMDSRKSERMGGHASGIDADGYMVADHMTRDKAEEWVRSMRSASGTQGQHWSMDQAKQVMHRHGLSDDPLEFYVVLNMMKSDYGKVAKKLGVDKEEFYACMADAFLNDEDAHKDKLERYYRSVVKR